MSVSLCFYFYVFFKNCFANSKTHDIKNLKQIGHRMMTNLPAAVQEQDPVQESKFSLNYGGIMYIARL